jgi:hypothetical protein
MNLKPYDKITLSMVCSIYFITVHEIHSYKSMIFTNVGYVVCKIDINFECIIVE